jgi:uncharacterized protein YecE (DUF72 family)
MDLQLGLFPDDTPRPAASPVSAAARSAGLSEIAHKLPRELRMGTSSWSFPGWEGIVYDRRASQQTLARHGLAAYAQHPLLRTVGIDRTFYRAITSDAFRGYADAVPEDFRFLVKADRLLTSPTDPEGRGVRGPNPRFLDPQYAANEVIGPMMEGLGRKAGPLLFQFPPIPPNLVGGRGPFVERLHGFLDALPKGPLYTIELRTAAFLTDSYSKVLLATGASHCYSVHPAMASLERQLESVHAYQQPALVMRWMLHSGLRYEVAKERYKPFDAIVDEDADTRERMAIAVLDAAIAEKGVFVIANNKAEGSAPLSIFRLAERIAEWEADASDLPAPYAS